MENAWARFQNHNFLNWMFRIAYNLARDIQRKRKLVSLPPGTEPGTGDATRWHSMTSQVAGPEDQAARVEQLKIIRSCMDRLDERQRRIVGYYSEGRSNVDIGTLEGLTGQRIGQLLRSALTTLRDCCGQPDTEMQA